MVMELENIKTIEDAKILLEKICDDKLEDIEKLIANKKLSNSQRAIYENRYRLSIIYKYQDSVKIKEFALEYGLKEEDVLSHVTDALERIAISKGVTLNELVNTTLLVGGNWKSVKLQLETKIDIYRNKVYEYIEKGDLEKTKMLLEIGMNIGNYLYKDDIAEVITFIDNDINEMLRFF